MSHTSEHTPAEYNSTFLFYGLLIYLPVFYSQIGFRIPALAPLRVEFIIGAILVAVIILKIIRGDISLNENKLTWAAIYFFGFLAFTIPFAFVKQLALDTYIAYVKFFAIYFMIISCINDEKRLKILVYVYLCCISLLFVEPFFLSLRGEGFRFANHMMRLYGVTGMFDHPNQLGGITAATMPIYFYMIWCHKSKLAKLLFASQIIIGLRVIMLTQSRTAFVGFAAFLFFAWLFSVRKVLGIVVLIVSSAIIWQFAPVETKERFLTMGRSVDIIEAQSDDEYEGDKELGSMNSRWILTRNSLIVFMENPILGVGIHNYQSISGRRWNSWFPPHCLYTEALSEIGLVGTLLFAYALVLIFKNLKQTRQILDDHDDTSFSYYLNKAIFVYLLVRLVVGIFGQDLYREWWWVAGAISVVNLRIVQNKYVAAGTPVSEPGPEKKSSERRTV